jgi:hypothetical protein
VGSQRLTAEVRHGLDRYVDDILNSFFNQLTAEERQYGYFQQDNATTHMAYAAMMAIREVFED